MKESLRKIAGCALIAGNLAIVAYVARTSAYHLDLDVYRIGARTWLNGGELYGELQPTVNGLVFPFTYPPIAAVLLAPTTLVPLPVAGALLSALTVVLLLVVIELVLRSIAPGRPHWWLAGALLPVAIVLEPVRNTLGYGQVNVVLMALVMADCLVKSPRWPRGALVGLAAAVKLTPAAFVLFFLLRKDYRAAVSACGSFAAATAAGFLLAGPDSVRYWTSTLYDTTRIGAPHFAGNQSLPAVLARLGLAGSARTGVWLLGAAAIVALAVLGMRRAFAAGLPGLAIGLNACAILVVSPVSWSHHWVLMVPVLLVMASLPRARVFAALGLVVFLAAPQWWFFPETMNREYEWNLGQQLVGNSYLWFAITVLTVAAAGRLSLVGAGRTPVPAGTGISERYRSATSCPGEGSARLR